MKERLTGAIILVVLIVLLVPELLSGPSRPAPAPQAAATSSEEPPLRSYTINLGDEAHSTSSAAGAGTASPQAAVPTQPPTIVEPPATAAAQPATPDEASQSREGPSQTSSPIAAAPPANPPSAGTAPKQPDMPAAQPQPSPPRHAQAPAPQRTDTTVAGWMVQLGVFAKHENADRLVQELKEQGFHAQVSESTGGGRTLWHVRAGPLAEHAAAEQLSAKLRAAGHAGAVVPK